MNISETGRVFFKAAAIDNRQRSDAAILAWHEILADLDFDDCLEAVAYHRRELPGTYLEPGHIRRHVKLLRDKRRPGTVLRELPAGKTQDDPARTARAATGAARVRQMLGELAAKRSIPGPETNSRPPTREESVHARALARARGERRTTGPAS